MEYWEMVVSLIAVIWAGFRASSWYEMRREANVARVFEALEIGVSIAWEKVIKPYLEKNEGAGKLPCHIKAEAERTAIDAAREVDSIVKKTSPAIVRATLKMAVEEAKRRGGK